ncbi:MAG: type II secretion system protein [Luteolibacter sp.]|uniref:type II secretion system protein n=1 Tax=Luteolibacter sp. TaxID=1962973 RepID=UPI0032631BC7
MSNPVRPSGRNGKSGMTLLEMTVVILVLLTLISVMFFGAKAWKRGSDRAMCIVLIQNVQKGVRSFSNLNGYAPGDNATNLQNQVIGMGKFVENTPICPGNGTYNFGVAFGVDTIPPEGELYMQCSLGTTEKHEPENHSEW